ncbi:hypothetical protein H4Q26_011604 [Puccinia striiformis f. sp. tritici PST-130]|nr:hypothetical protein H4Q26_011604 [Puccinia striiformis f. sp. tritici PST-130]
MLGSVFNKITETTNINNLRQIQATYDPLPNSEAPVADQSTEESGNVGDRLAYMNYQVGDIHQQCSQTLERSRSDLKDIRNLENELIKLREREKALQLQINKSQQDSRKKVDSTMIAEHESLTQLKKTAQIKGAASLNLSDYHQTVHSTPINHPLSLSSSLHRSDTRLFGETHRIF